MSNWLSILTSPRATIRSILDSDSARGFYLLPAIIGVLMAPSVALFLDAIIIGYTLPIWLGSFVLSVLSYWMYVSVYGMVYRWIGGWFDATGTKRDAQLALAWTQIPFIYIAIVFLPIQLLLRDSFYPEVDLSSIASMLESVQTTGDYYWISTAFSIPKFIAYIISLKLGEALGVSAWKAFGIKVIALLLHIPLFLVAGFLAIPLSIGYVLLTQ